MYALVYPESLAHQNSWLTRDVQVSKTAPITIPRAVLGTSRRGIIDFWAMFGVPGAENLKQPTKWLGKLEHTSAKPFF